MKPDPRPGTEKWIAEQLGISRMSLSRYRKGSRPIPSEISEQLALLDEQAEEFRRVREEAAAGKEEPCP